MITVCCKTTEDWVLHGDPLFYIHIKAGYGARDTDDWWFYGIEENGATSVKCESCLREEEASR